MAARAPERRAVVGETTATVNGRTVRVIVEGPPGSGPPAPAARAVKIPAARRIAETVARASTAKDARLKAKASKQRKRAERAIGRLVLSGFEWLLDGTAEPEDLTDDGA